MVRKKKKQQLIETLPWCWYCDREFDDEKVLITHQRAKHFKCPQCSKKMNTVGGLVIHYNQVHKETLKSTPNAIPGRDAVDMEIFGMEGVPEEDKIVRQLTASGQATAPPGHYPHSHAHHPYHHPRHPLHPIAPPPRPNTASLNQPLSPEELRAQLARHQAALKSQSQPVTPITPSTPSAPGLAVAAAPSTYQPSTQPLQVPPVPVMGMPPPGPFGAMPPPPPPHGGFPGGFPAGMPMPPHGMPMHPPPPHHGMPGHMMPHNYGAFPGAPMPPPPHHHQHHHPGHGQPFMPPPPTAMGYPHHVPGASPMSPASAQAITPASSTSTPLPSATPEPASMADNNTKQASVPQNFIAADTVDTHPAPVTGPILVYDDNDISMEEKRARLPRYRYVEAI